MSLQVKIEGYEQAQQMLATLPDKVGRKLMVQTLRKAVRPVVQDAKVGVQSRSKRVAKSIKAWEPKKKGDSPVLFIGPKFSRNRDADPWFAHIIEGGAKGVGRFVTKKNKAGKNTDNDGKQIFRFINAKRMGAQRYRKDQAAHPFMEPAVQRNRENVRNIFVNDLDGIIQKHLKSMSA